MLINKYRNDNEFNLLSKLKLFKTLNEKLNIINKFIDEYSYSINLFVKNKKALYLSVILTIAQLTVFFSVSYCIYRAFNLNEETYIYILSLQAILYMSISAVPTPGNVGANEIAFFMIFASVFPKSIIGYCVFLYSVFVYYFLVIVGGLFNNSNASIHPLAVEEVCRLKSFSSHKLFI